MKREEIIRWLRLDDESRLECLWRIADDIRSRCVGDEVYLRGLIEISNYCKNNCLYCGIRAGNTKVSRYRLSAEEILECAEKCVELRYGTIVMQGGEDAGIKAEWLAEIIREIKLRTNLAVTLSLGNRSVEELFLWKQAGADRYLIRFETSDCELFSKIHRGNVKKGDIGERINIICQLREIGYEIGSGVMIGLPGQSYASLARDIELMCELDLDMIGIGPYIPHPDTPLYFEMREMMLPEGEQVPNTELMSYKVMALIRKFQPFANIPSTTAIATLNGDAGRQLGLMRGANVIMPNLTPMKYRRFYEIYPNKACLFEADDFDRIIKNQINSIGRKVGVGRGDSRNKLYREKEKCLRIWS